MRRRLNSQDELVRTLERRVLEGDLSAVSALARAYERRGEGKDPVDEIVDQINDLKKAGLLTVDARRSIKNNVSPVITDETVAAIAQSIHHRDGEVEIDSNAELSIGAENGCYVQAWVWVDLDDEDLRRIQAKEARE
jgi:hypothetical protein